jgi:chromosome partitioning protein
MIFAVSNQKGGVGKTTTTINLGVYLARLGKKVLLLDMDPQANLTSGLGYGKTLQDSKELLNKNIYQVMSGELDIAKIFVSTNTPNLYLAPSGIELAGAEVELVNQLSRETILKAALESIKNNFDYILIDCPPSLGILTINALVAADKILIPVQCEYFALEGLSQLLNTVKLVKTRLNNLLEIGGVILTMYDTRTNLAKQVATEVQKFFTDKVFNSIVPRNVRLSEAPSHGQPISEYDPQSNGAFAYENLAKEVIQKYK